MGAVSQTQPEELTQLLQQSAETRMRAIEEKISISATFCTSVELEIRLGNVHRAKDSLHKLHSAIDRLAAHINNPAHISDQRIKQKFREQLTLLMERVSFLQSEVKDAQSGNSYNSVR